jgi:hypothetical protein
MMGAEVADPANVAACSCYSYPESPVLALSRLIRNARASAAIGGKADPDYTTLAELDFLST